MKEKKSQRGFTLIELMVVIIILGILAAAIVPQFRGKTLQAQIATTKTNIEALSTSVDMFETDNGIYPTSAQGLKALIEKPTSTPSPVNWNGPYLKANSIPKDPWGNEYVYECPGSKNPQWYDLLSPGPDGKKDTDDDIGNWDKD